MDRIHAYLPGWDVPKLDPSYFTEHFGLVSDYLAEVWSQLRRLSRLDVPRVAWNGDAAQRARPQGREQHCRWSTELLWPNPDIEVPDECPGVGGSSSLSRCAGG